MILLARHGETDDNAPPTRVMGWIDTPLNARGREQALALADAVADAGLEAIWTSHLLRARETAEIVGAAVGVQPRVDERLAESRRGSWEGRLLTDIEREEPEAWAGWTRGGDAFRFPGGESLAEHQRRAVAVMDEVAAGPLPALVVAHGGTIRAIAAHHHPRGLDAYPELAVPNATVIRLDTLVSP
ncbi:MAG: 2,3-bisphosphoglycerate-dependent phosphoglycerate mutase [Solirubrobacteraceae bacterium]|nr:2,3-bisphosphoglycerate-dependent phosphoglycerate mutase [Solirubrobacteraceae bacterium]